jgi:hypothetical protein
MSRPLSFDFAIQIDAKRVPGGSHRCKIGSGRGNGAWEVVGVIMEVRAYRLKLGGDAEFIGLFQDEALPLLADRAIRLGLPA